MCEGKSWLVLVLGIKTSLSSPLAMDKRSFWTMLVDELNGEVKMKSRGGGRRGEEEDDRNEGKVANVWELMHCPESVLGWLLALRHFFTCLGLHFVATTRVDKWT